jgi:hypothetical protein
LIAATVSSSEEVSAGRVAMMKRFLGLTVLILGLSVSAHAQSRGGAVAGGSAGGVLSNNGGGGYGGGGGFGGAESAVNFPALPTIGPANLPSSEVSGTDADFVPSTFLPYKQAIAAGQKVLDAQHKSVAEAAAENSRARRLKAKAAMIENAAGNAIITTP